MSSPSEWGGGRDAGHDALVMDTYYALKGRHWVQAIDVEWPLVKDHRVISFVDLRITDRRGGGFWYVECKPKIESVGQILRQLRAQAVLLSPQLLYEPDTAKMCITGSGLILALRKGDPNIPLVVEFMEIAMPKLTMYAVTNYQES